MPPLHPGSVLKARVGLSNLIADANGGIASIDINPFLVSTRNRIAVDAVVLKNAPSEALGDPRARAMQAHKPSRQRSMSDVAMIAATRGATKQSARKLRRDQSVT
ncbi:hypothetical protein BSZ21_00740 [Bradyrhizobium canariense]|nr:hypothetical protein BSZ21_00740 [Bradyrhizobium canariense]